MEILFFNCEEIEAGPAEQSIELSRVIPYLKQLRDARPKIYIHLFNQANRFFFYQLSSKEEYSKCRIFEIYDFGNRSAIDESALNRIYDLYAEVSILLKTPGRQTLINFFQAIVREVPPAAHVIISQKINLSGRRIFINSTNLYNLAVIGSGGLKLSERLLITSIPYDNSDSIISFLKPLANISMPLVRDVLFFNGIKKWDPEKPEFNFPSEVRIRLNEQIKFSIESKGGFYTSLGIENIQNTLANAKSNSVIFFFGHFDSLGSFQGFNGEWFSKKMLDVVFKSHSEKNFLFFPIGCNTRSTLDSLFFQNDFIHYLLHTYNLINVDVLLLALCELFTNLLDGTRYCHEAFNNALQDAILKYRIIENK